MATRLVFEHVLFVMFFTTSLKHMASQELLMRAKKASKRDPNSFQEIIKKDSLGFYRRQFAFLFGVLANMAPRQAKITPRGCQDGLRWRQAEPRWRQDDAKTVVKKWGDS